MLAAVSIQGDLKLYVLELIDLGGKEGGPPGSMPESRVRDKLFLCYQVLAKLQGVQKF